jgi:voltage-gated potassium channel
VNPGRQAGHAGLARLVLRRIGVPFLALNGTLIVGSFGYQLIGAMNGREWTFLDCLFMSVITLVTVGYSDDLGVHQFIEGRAYTIALILAGAGVAAYAFSSITAFVVEGHIRRYFQERRMQRTLSELSGHTIICGCGTTGMHVAKEHVNTGVPFILIDTSQDAIDQARAFIGDPEVPAIVGDATDEKVLDSAGIDRARALVSALHDDKENMFLVVAARYRRKEMPIVVKVHGHGREGKFKAAGATEVVSPTFIGGMRLASLVVRPQVVTFLDTMLRSKGTSRVSEATVAKGSKLDGTKLGDARLQDDIGLAVVALKRPSDADFVYAPKGDELLSAGTTLVVIGPMERVPQLEAMARA